MKGIYQKIFKLGISFLLFCGMLILLKATLGSYKTWWQGNASARIAKFSCQISTLSLLDSDSTLDLNLTSDQVTYSFQLENNSEVDVRYQLSVQNVPTGVRVILEKTQGTLEKNGGAVKNQCSIQVLDPDNPPAADIIQGMKLEGIFTQMD